MNISYTRAELGPKKNLLVQLMAEIDETRSHITDPENWLIIYPEAPLKPSDKTHSDEKPWKIVRKAEGEKIEGTKLDLGNLALSEILCLYVKVNRHMA